MRVFSAKSRVYRYFITKVNLPFFTRYAWFIPQDLDVEMMKKSASLFVGEHDFCCYGKPMVPGGSTVRIIYRCQVKDKLGRLEVLVEANAFLRKMVRNIVGALVKVGMGKSTLEELQASIDQQKPLRVLKPALPNGLFLWKVKY